MKWKRIWLLVLFLAGTMPLIAQNDSYAVLFQGRQATPYLTKYNGTPFLVSPEYRKGDVLYNGVLYQNVWLNVDAVEQELLAKADDSMVGTVVAREQVSWFTIGSQLFVNLRYQGYADAPAGYWQVLYDGSDAALKQVRKVFYSEPGDKNGDVIGYYDPDYNYELLEHFRYSAQYFVLKDGKLVPVSRNGDLRRLYPAQRRAIRQEAERLNIGRKEIDRYAHTTMELVDKGGEPAIRSKLVLWQPSEYSYRARKTGVRVLKPHYDEDLPAAYFSVQEREPDPVVDENAVLATFRNKVYTIGDARTQKGTRATISGYIRDLATGEPLEAVTVYDERTRTYVQSNKKGFYRITLPTGENQLHFTEFTREDMDLQVVVNGSGSFDVIMKEKVTQLSGALISSESMAAHRTARIGVETVSMKTISKIPSAFGEGDVIKAVLTLPGVKSVGEASGGFNVRGGAADQNLILFNGGTLYNPSHMFGVFSAFNPDVVEGVELYKSSIPANFGGRISSVLDVKSKDGDPKKVRGSAGIGLLTSRLQIEGPLKKDRTTFVLGGRITYSDWILGLLPDDSGYAGGKAGFNDANLSVTHKVNAENTLRLSGYWSADRFSFSGDTTFRYHNLNASIAWINKPNASRTRTFSAGFDRYGNTLENTFSDTEGYTLDTRINQFWAKLDFERKYRNHTFIYGLQGTFYDLQGGHMKPASAQSFVPDHTLPAEKAVDGALYFGDTWQAADKLTLEGGARLNVFAAMDPSKIYFGPELRISGKYAVQDNLSVKAGFNTMRQNIHLISNSSSISPMDTWKLSGEQIKPTTGWQAAAGVYWTVFGSQVDLSAEVYWKQMSNYLDYKSGAKLVMNPDLADDLVTTYGRAYGIELMARKSAGRLNGWVSYTWSRSLLKEMEDRGLAAINAGDWYNAPHDKPHDVKMVANFKLTRRYSFSANLEYATGRPVTIPIGYYQYGGGFRLAYSERNAYRIPDYFRLDLAINIDPGHYLKALAHASVTIGCYNVTGRKNPYSVYYTTEGGQKVTGHMLSVFATQIPYINLNILF